MPMFDLVVAGAAGALVKHVAGNAVDWLLRLVGREKLHLRTQQNLINFVQRLATRVDTLEAELTGEAREVFDAALGDPSTGLLIHKAVLNAAATPPDDRHEILATLIVERMRCAGDDLTALAGQAACDLIPSLAPRHIHFLALAAGLHIQPEGRSEWDDITKTAFWRSRLPKLLVPDLDQVGTNDVGHLVSLGAVRITPYVDFRLGDLLQLASVRGLPDNDRVLGMLEGDAWWPRLHRLWSYNMQSMLLGSTGFMVGALHHDRVLGVRTDLGWSART